MPDDSLYASAMALPDEQRRELAEALLDSLPAREALEIEAAWVAEASRRAGELERGEVEALDAGAVLAAIRARLPSRRE